MKDKVWLQSFNEKNGHPPRILHIGNIANNAYLNAKMLNEAGFDNDVICYDYYHIMGCPEWEDADFDGEIDDQFRPDWTQVDLRGFKRPRWFAQGPLVLCIEYLIARRTRAKRCSEKAWRALCKANGTESLTGWSERKDHLAVSVRNLSPVKSLIAAIHVISNFFKRSELIYSNFPFAKRIADLQDLYKQEFPSRIDQLSIDDLLPYSSVIANWKKLFEYYEIVLGYSTDPILPLLAGNSYMAFEHGTIRTIPYQQTAEGRKTSLSYRLAKHVFVTNFDCKGSAEQLAPGRFTLINHPYDEDHGLAVTGWEEQRKRLCQELESEFFFFFPTRQDWVAGTGYADKGNDIFLGAFTVLRKGGFKVGLVCCAWGANVQQSKALLQERGCSRYVRWVEPLATVQFERMSRAAHCVVDQFVIGSFGGIVFKAMAVGAPIVTFLNETLITQQYPECPPIINCRTEAEVIDKMTFFLQAPSKLTEIGKSARAWMKRYHSKAETIMKQTDQFKSFLAVRGGKLYGQS